MSGDVGYVDHINADHIIFIRTRASRDVGSLGYTWVHLVHMGKLG